MHYFLQETFLKCGELLLSTDFVVVNLSKAEYFQFNAICVVGFCLFTFVILM